MLPKPSNFAAHTLKINPDAGSTARQKIFDAFRIHDLAAELILELHPKAEAFALHLQSEPGESFATISCSNKSGGRELEINGASASLSGSTRSPVHLHVFLDGSVLELFANGTGSLTKRIYQVPSSPERRKTKNNSYNDLIFVGSPSENLTLLDPGNRGICFPTP